MAAISAANRDVYVARGRRLEYFTIAYNCLEGLTSIFAGLIAGSVSLVGFGLDSLIEVTSGAAVISATTRTFRGARKSSELRYELSELASLRWRYTSFTNPVRC